MVRLALSYFRVRVGDMVTVTVRIGVSIRVRATLIPIAYDVGPTP